MAAFGIAAAWLALSGNPVGDYGVEADFYGGYAQGARMVQQGHWDPRRYIVVGPVYETALALASAVVPDPFLAAKLLSLAAALGVLVLWFRAVARRTGAVAGAWALGFLAINPVFLRHAYAASTDMLAVFLQAGAMSAMLVGRAGRMAAAAGFLAGLATLTRYSSIYLLPGAALLYGRLGAGSRRSSLGWFAAGFLAVAIPWFAYSTSSGVIPGEMLLRGYGFYAAEGPGRNLQDALRELDRPEPVQGSWKEVVLDAPVAFAARLLSAIPHHLAEDARTLWGWPSSIALLAGLAILTRSARGPALAPIAGLGVLCFLALLPAFHSSRYSLPLTLFHATAAGGLAWSSVSISLPRVTGPLVRAGGMVALGLLLASSLQHQRRVLAESPTEVAAAGRALERRSVPAERVISRKGHIGYYSGREVVPFPRVRTLGELGAHARSAGAGYLYYSWYETQLRPEFAYLLDTTSAIPGLSAVYVSGGKPAVLYRIGPGFGRSPEWLADPFEHSVHLARGVVLARGEEAPSVHHAALAFDALLRGRWSESVAHARNATWRNPQDAVSWTVAGEGLRRLGRHGEAREAFLRAAALDPSDPTALIGLGRLERSAGDRERATRWWQAAAARAQDGAVQAEIHRLLEQVADSSGARHR